MSGARAAIGFGAVALLLGVLPVLRGFLDLPLFYLIFLFSLFFWITQATSWNMLTGYSGYFSFGQGAFFGIGVYTTAILTAKMGWPFLATLPVAGIMATVAGLGIGVVVFRLRKLKGEIFALMTLAVAFVVAAGVRVTPFLGGGSGVPLHTVPTPTFLGDFTTTMYVLGLLIALLTVITAYLIQRSRFGWGLFSIRDDEDVAEGLGIPTFRYKMMALAVSTFFAGLSGGLQALQITFVTIEDVFNIRVPLFVILMSVLGGTRHWMGPVVGAVIIFTLTDRLNSAGLESLNQIIIGGLLILMVVGVKEGIYLRLQGRRWESLGLFVLALVGVSLFLDTGLITRLAYAMVVVLVLLLIPPRWYPGGKGGRAAEVAEPLPAADLDAAQTGGGET